MKTWFKAEMGKSNIKGKNMDSKCCWYKNYFLPLILKINK